jgi:hypothetical protein
LSNNPKPRHLRDGGASFYAVLTDAGNLFLFCSMAALPHRKPTNQVDPNRFTGKSFTRRKTFPNLVDDYVVIVAGLLAGRIMKKTLSFQRVAWFWSMYGPYYPSPTGCSGEEETLEKAQDAFKVCFWQWQAWALNQPGKATWYGAE